MTIDFFSCVYVMLVLTTKRKEEGKEEAQVGTGGQADNSDKCLVALVLFFSPFNSCLLLCQVVEVMYLRRLNLTDM